MDSVLHVVLIAPYFIHLADNRKHTNFVKKIMRYKKQLINEAFEISGDIRYMAVYDDDGLSMKQRSEITNVSSNESE